MNLNRQLIKGFLFSGISLVLSLYECTGQNEPRWEILFAYGIVFVYGIAVIKFRYKQNEHSTGDEDLDTVENN